MSHKRVSLGLFHHYSCVFNPHILNLFLFTIQRRIIFKFEDQLSVLSRIWIRGSPTPPDDTLQKPFSVLGLSSFDGSSALGGGGDGKTDTLLTGSFLVLSSSLCLDLRILCTYIIKRLRLNKAFVNTASKPCEPAHIPGDAYGYICISGSGLYFSQDPFDIAFPPFLITELLPFLCWFFLSTAWTGFCSFLIREVQPRLPWPASLYLLCLRLRFPCLCCPSRVQQTLMGGVRESLPFFPVL